MHKSNNIFSFLGDQWYQLEVLIQKLLSMVGD